MTAFDRATILLAYAKKSFQDGSHEVGVLLLREARRVMDDYVQAPLQYLDLVIKSVDISETYQVQI